MTRSSGRRRGQSGAIGQQRIVGQHGAHADHDGVVRVAQLLHVGARGFAGDPAAAGRRDAVIGWRLQLRRRRRDLAIQRHRRLQRDEGTFVANVLGERLVQLSRLGLQQPFMNLDSRRTKFRHVRRR